MNKGQPSHFSDQLHATVDRWAAMLPDEVRAAFRQDVTRLGLVHERALTTLERILERSARAHGVDSATGLATRRPFHERLASLVAASDDDPSLVVGVIFIDVNKLKQINDTLGHQGGDRALAAISVIVREAVRIDCGLDVVGGPLSPESEAVGRQGGDEFVVALRLAESSSLDSVARRIKTRADDAGLQREHGYSGPPELTVAVGGVAYQSTPAIRELAANSIATALLAASDDLMYRGKRDGQIHLATARFDGQLMNLTHHRALGSVDLPERPASVRSGS